jgi:hypothetical protein
VSADGQSRSSNELFHKWLYKHQHRIGGVERAGPHHLLTYSRKPAGMKPWCLNKNWRPYWHITLSRHAAHTVASRTYQTINPTEVDNTLECIFLLEGLAKAPTSSLETMDRVADETKSVGVAHLAHPSAPIDKNAVVHRRDLEADIVSSPRTPLRYLIPQHVLHPQV